MNAIYIPRLLNAPQKTEEILLKEFIAGLDTLTPVRGLLTLTHGGTYLDVSLTVETILTLTCDRCLQQYNHRLKVNTSELLWLDAKANQLDFLPLDKDLSQTDLAETLNPDGYFEVNTWIYEQLSLALPFRQLCGKNCQIPNNPISLSPLQDSRWSALAAFKDQLET